MIAAAVRNTPGIQARAASVSVQGAKTGFRPDWRVPDTAFWGTPGVQEVMFITIASDSKTDGARFKKPYRSIFRFPLDPATGSPYPPGTGADQLPCYVHCTCPAFRYYSEVALNREQNSDIIESDGSYPRKNNPGLEPYVCKHLFATAKQAMQKRPSIGVTASVYTNQAEPGRLKPKGRQPIDRRRGERPVRSTNRTSKTPLTASNRSVAQTGLPATWIGRLVYVLFGER